LEKRYNATSHVIWLIKHYFDELSSNAYSLHGHGLNYDAIFEKATVDIVLERLCGDKWRKVRDLYEDYLFGRIKYKLTAEDLKALGLAVAAFVAPAFGFTLMQVSKVFNEPYWKVKQARWLVIEVMAKEFEE